MSELHDVSSKIGQLLAMAVAQQNQTSTLFAKFDKLNEEVIEQRGAIKILGSQFSEHRIENAKDHSKFDGVSKEFDETKNKGKGLAVGVGIIGGGGGLAGFFSAAKSFFGGA